MDVSLAYLKKVLKFGILLAGIQFSGLQSGLGEYTPNSLKGFTSNAIDTGSKESGYDPFFTHLGCLK